MNIENLDKLIAALEAAPDSEFDMRNYFSLDGEYARRDEVIKGECGTAACLAGWCVWVSGETSSNSFSTARDWLGLGHFDAERLFLSTDLYYDEISRKVAIATLKRLRKTGKVNWGRAPKAKAGA